MLDGLVPLLILPGQGAQHILRAGVGWINRQFLLEFAFGLFSHGRSEIRLGKQNASQPVVNAWHVRVLRQDLTIFFLSFVPLALHFQRLRIELMRLGRGRRRRRQLQRGSRGKIRISVHRKIKDIRIVRKFTLQKAQEVDSSFRLANRHRAAHARETGIAFQPRVRIMLRRSLKPGNCLFAMAGLGQIHRLLAGGRDIRYGFLCDLGVRVQREKDGEN